MSLSGPLWGFLSSSFFITIFFSFFNRWQHEVLLSVNDSPTKVRFTIMCTNCKNGLVHLDSWSNEENCYYFCFRYWWRSFLWIHFRKNGYSSRRKWRRKMKEKSKRASYAQRNTCAKSWYFSESKNITPIARRRMPGFLEHRKGHVHYQKHASDGTFSSYLTCWW